MPCALPLLAALLAPTAHARDAVTVEAVLQARPQDGGAVGTGGGVRADLGGLFVAGEGRALGHGAWIGRATAGLDLFGGSELLDLTFGGFAGMAGGLVPDLGATPTYGVELGVGLNAGRFTARYRRAMGLTGAWSGLLSEDEVRLGLRLGEERRVTAFGQAVSLRSQDPAAEDATGLGAGVAFAF